MEVTVNKENSPFKIIFHVIEELLGAHPCILGADTMRELGGKLDYGDPPTLCFTHPLKLMVNTYYIQEKLLQSCSAYVNLSPGESKPIRLYLHPASRTLCGDKVFVDGGVWADTELIPSQSNVHQDNRGYYCIVMCLNLTQSNVYRKLTAYFEPTTDESQTIKITPMTIANLENIPIFQPCWRYEIDDLRNTKVYIEEIPENINENPYKIYEICGAKSPLTEKQVNDVFKEKENFIDRGPTQPDIDDEFCLPKGYSVENQNYELEPKDIVQLEKFPSTHRDYIEDIFINSFPQVLAKSSLAVGNLSATLGYYTVRLKPGVELPSHTKMYYLNESDKKHLSDILEFMKRKKIIMKCPTDPATLNSPTVQGAPSYLIPRSSRDSAARLIVDFSHFNNLIATEVPIIPPVTSVVNQLRDYGFFSVIDLSNAFPSISLHPSCRHLCKFNCDLGSFQYLKLPAGLVVCPTVLARMVHRMLHEKIIYNEEGNMIFEDSGIVKMEPDHLEGVQGYYDDIIISSKVKNTYEETVKNHFSLVKKVVSRLAEHSAIIGFHKCDFGKAAIKFLGQLVCNNFVIMDDARISKLREAELPQTVKGWRSFCGLLNSLRPYLPPKVMPHLYKITPLTACHSKIKPSDEQIDAFQTLKIAITSEPVFGNIISPYSEKLLFVDASSQEGSYWSSVLCQVVESDNTKHREIPQYLNLDDKCDQLIFDRKLSYRPILPNLYTLEAQEVNKTLARTQLPLVNYLDKPYFGYSKERHNDSLFISVKNIQTAYRCKVWDTLDMRQQCTKLIRKSELGLNIYTFVFNKDKTAYKQFLAKFEAEGGAVDERLYSVQALAQVLMRPFIIISTLSSHASNPIIQYNTKYQKPPFIFGLYRSTESGNLIFRPYYIDKQDSYNLAKETRKVEIVAYHTRSMPPTKKSAHSLEQEALALINALTSLKPYIGGSKVTCFTDSRAMYLLFSRTVRRSSSKLERWSLKISSDFANVNLRFVKSGDNIADFLSKSFRINNPADACKIDIKRYDISFSSDISDKTFTIKEWQDFVDRNPQYLQLLNNSNECIPKLNDDTSITPTVATINVNRLGQAIDKHLQPIEKLDACLSYNEIVRAQSVEYQNWKKTCVLSGNDSFVNKAGDTIILHFGLLYYQHNKNPKLIVPNKLVPILLACAHLKTGHGGYSRMLLALENHWFDNKDKLIREITSKCCSCQLVNISSHKNAICQYPMPKNPFEVVALDLAEDFNKQGHYKHLLIACCMLSDGIYLFPLKSKSSQEVSHNLIYGLFQFHDVKKILADNGPCFNSVKYTELFATLNIERIHTSRFHPASKGFVERKVRLVKDLMKKFLISQDEHNWMGLEYIITKLLNNTPSPRTNFSPNELIFGRKIDAFENKSLVKLHPLVQNHEKSLVERHKALMENISKVRDKIASETEKRNKKLNKNKINHSKIKIGDLVFCKDRQIILGNPRPLKSHYSHSPYVVENVKFSTAQVRRLADNFTQIYSLNDLKRYEEMDPFLLNIPEPVRSILKGDFKNVNPRELKTIQDNDPYDFPGGIPFTEAAELEHQDSDESDEEPDEVTTEFIPPAGNKSLQPTHPIADSKTLNESGKTAPLETIKTNASKNTARQRLQTIPEGRGWNLRRLARVQYSK